jgi:hypothetical protein
VVRWHLALAMIVAGQLLVAAYLEAVRALDDRTQDKRRMFEADGPWDLRGAWEALLADGEPWTALGSAEMWRGASDQSGMGRW